MIGGIYQNIQASSPHESSSINYLTLPWDIAERHVNVQPRMESSPYSWIDLAQKIGAKSPILVGQNWPNRAVSPNKHQKIMKRSEDPNK